MGVGSVLIALQASFLDGCGVTEADFLVPLAIQANEVEATVATGNRWMAGVVHIAVVRISEYSAAVEPTEAFFAAVGAALTAAGQFLDRRDPSVFSGFRALGLRVRIFIDVRMDQDQMEIEFPPSFLAACGRMSLPILLMSNDISADDAIRAGAR